MDVQPRVDGPAGAAMGSGGEAAGSPDAERVLVVGSAAERADASRFLGRSGFDAVTAGTLHSAVGLLEDAKPQYVISYARFPGAEGERPASQVRAILDASIYYAVRVAVIDSRKLPNSRVVDIYALQPGAAAHLLEETLARGWESHDYEMDYALPYLFNMSYAQAVRAKTADARDMEHFVMRPGLNGIEAGKEAMFLRTASILKGLHAGEELNARLLRGREGGSHSAIVDGKTAAVGARPKSLCVG